MRAILYESVSQYFAVCCTVNMSIQYTKRCYFREMPFVNISYMAVILLFG